MELHFEHINWLAIGACVVVGQVFLTVWFAALFAKPWALAYGVEDPKQHTREIPGYTYGIGALCVLLLSIGLSLVQAGLGVSTLPGALAAGLLLAVCFGVATAVPGYAFLKRWRACVLAVGSQAALILVLSSVLVLMR